MPTLSTPAQVCNLALAHVGQRLAINSLLEQSAEARVCAVHYPTARDACLEAHWWKFATRRAQLALLSGVTREGWEYVYAAPGDMVSIVGARYLETGGRPRRPDTDIPFAIELNDTGNAFVVLCDVKTPQLVYTRATDTPALWPAHFLDALAWALAVRLALALPVKPEVARALEPKAQLAMLAAIAADVRTGTPDVAPSAAHHLVR